MQTLGGSLLFGFKYTASRTKLSGSRIVSFSEVTAPTALLSFRLMDPMKPAAQFLQANAGLRVRVVYQPVSPPNLALLARWRSQLWNLEASARNNRQKTWEFELCLQGSSGKRLQSRAELLKPVDLSPV